MQVFIRPNSPIAILSMLLAGYLMACGSGCQMAADGSNIEGTRLYRQGQYQAAISKFQESLAVSPHNADAYYNLAATYHQMGKMNSNPATLQQAEELYHRCLDINTNHVDCRRGLAVLLTETKRSDKAMLMLQRWVQSSPQSADARVGLAQLCEELGDKQTAKLHLTQALAISPNNCRALNGLAKYREEEGNTAQALANYQRSYQLDNFQPQIQERIATLQKGFAAELPTGPNHTRLVRNPAEGTPRY